MSFEQSKNETGPTVRAEQSMTEDPRPDDITRETTKEDAKKKLTFFFFSLFLFFF